MDLKKDLWKYAYAWASFRDVVEFANKTIEIFEPSNDLLIKALSNSIITSYGRPFKQNNSLRLRDDFIEATDKESHDFLIELRDKVIAHQDPVTTETGFGFLNQVNINYSGENDWQFSTIHPRITPEKCSEIIKLASRLLSKCDKKIKELLKEISVTEVMQKGKYCISPNPVKGNLPFIFKRIET